MYIIVRESDQVIIGSAMNPVDEKDCNAKGYKVFELDAKDFSPAMLGSKLDSFDSKS